MTSQPNKPAVDVNGLSERAISRPALDMKSAIIKRSIELNGHKTSVSLEDEFWMSLRTIDNQQDISMPSLLQTIDSSREGANLSSAIRVYVLSHYRTLAAARMAADPDPRLPPPSPLRF